MTKKTKLKLCDWSLLFLTAVILASGIQLEINPTGANGWVWAHIAIGVLFISGISWHIGIHKTGKKNQIKKPRTHKKHHPMLAIFFLLTLLSAVMATCHWVGTYIHSSIGGIHGKIGFLFIIAIVAHIWNKRRFYNRKVTA